MFLFAVYCPTPNWTWVRRGYYEEMDTCEWFVSEEIPKEAAIWVVYITHRFCNLCVTWDDTHQVDKKYTLVAHQGGVRYYVWQTDEAQPEPEPKDEVVTECIDTVTGGTTEPWRSRYDILREQIEKANASCHAKQFEDFTLFREMFANGP